MRKGTDYLEALFNPASVAVTEAGIPVYYSMSSAARAIDHVIQYYERRQARGTD